MAITTKQCVLWICIGLVSIQYVSCKSRDATSSRALSDEQSQKAGAVYTASGMLNAVRTAVYSQIAQTKFDAVKDSQGARKQVFELAVGIQSKLVEYSNSVMNDDELNLTPDFYAMVSPESRQLFDILDMTVPEICDPRMTADLNKRLSAEQYLVERTEYKDITDPKATLDKMQEKLEVRIFLPMEKLIVAYDKNHKKVSRQDFKDVRPADRLKIEVPIILDEISGTESFLPSVQDPVVQRSMVLNLAVKIRSIFENISGPTADGVAASYPNFYEMISPDIKQLFDILGRELPEICDPNQTPDFTSLKDAETYLNGSGNYENLGDPAATLKSMRTSVQIITTKMTEMINAYEKNKKK